MSQGFVILIPNIYIDAAFTISKLRALPFVSVPVVAIAYFEFRNAIILFISVLVPASVHKLVALLLLLGYPCPNEFPPDAENKFAKQTCEKGAFGSSE